MRLTLTSVDENSILPTLPMMKDTKTYKCDGCNNKTHVFDFYNQSDASKMALVEKELASWITIRMSARRAGKDAPPLIPETVGHACCEKCVKLAIANIAKKNLPE